MKHNSSWIQVTQIAFKVEDRMGKRLPFPCRGFSPLEIASYLLKEQKQHLKCEEIDLLKKCMNRRVSWSGYKDRSD